MQLTNKDIKRFWCRVEKKGPDDCWLWLGAKGGNGYGRFAVCRRLEGTHRVAYTLVYGPIPTDMHVLHTCDNPACCNPKHLWLGTPKNNVQDMVAKGRGKGFVYGERHRNAKLTEVQVREIRKLYATGNYSYRELARMYGVANIPIYYIIARKTWKHI